MNNNIAGINKNITVSHKKNKQIHSDKKVDITKMSNALNNSTEKPKIETKPEITLVTKPETKPESNLEPKLETNLETKKWHWPPSTVTMCQVNLTNQNQPIAPVRKPVIGILIDKESFLGSVFQMNAGKIDNYTRAVEEFGGIVKIIENSAKQPIKELLTGVHGVLIPGGKDINPKIYNENINPTKNVDLAPEDFDQFEIDVAKEAMNMKIPIRGICRGHQILTVSVPGGKLMQDIPSDLDLPVPYYSGSMHRGGQHSIVIAQKSRLHSIFGTDSLEVNSWHHQATLTVPPGFMAVAWAAHNVIEAIEKKDNPNVIGVQFHPEKSGISYNIKQKFFTSFIDDAKKYQNVIDPQPLDAVTTEAELTLNEAVPHLLNKGYKFFLEQKPRKYMTDTEMIFEAAKKSNPALCISIPESPAFDSVWIMPDYKLFEETVLIEAGQDVGKSEKREDLKMIKELLAAGTIFSSKERPNIPLNSRSSVLFNLYNETLFSSKQTRLENNKPVTREDIRRWTQKLEQNKTFFSYQETRESNAKINAISDAIDKFANRGLVLMNRWKSPFSKEHIKMQMDADEISIARETDAKPFVRITGRQQVEEFMFSESGHEELLSPWVREHLDNMKQLKNNGAEFFVSAGGFRGKFGAKIPIKFNIEAVWELQSMKTLYVKHPKYKDDYEEVTYIGQLNSILKQYQPDMKPVVLTSSAPKKEANAAEKASTDTTNQVPPAQDIIGKEPVVAEKGSVDTTSRTVSTKDTPSKESNAEEKASGNTTNQTAPAKDITGKEPVVIEKCSDDKMKQIVMAKFISSKISAAK